MVSPVWERLAKRNQLYLTDILLLNSILFIFPAEDLLNIQKFIFRNREKYKRFQHINRIKINSMINATLVFMNNKKIKPALEILNPLIELCKKEQAFIQLAIAYIRKGICLNRHEQQGERWIKKGKNILLILEQNNLLHEVEKEIKHPF